MTAKIVMSAGGPPVIGSLVLTAAQVNTPVLLSNLDNTNVEGWKWEILDAPEESPTLIPLPPATFANTRTVTPDVIGHTILIRLTTYLDVGRTQVDDTDQKAIKVRYPPPFDWIIPAAGETVELDLLRGWATEVNRLLRDVHENMGMGTGGGESAGLRRITDSEVETIGPNQRLLLVESLDIDDGELDLEGELHEIDQDRNYSEDVIPHRTQRIVPTGQVLLHRGLRIDGALVGDIYDVRLTGPALLDILGTVLPEDFFPVGGGSPAQARSPAQVRAILNVPTIDEIPEPTPALVFAPNVETSSFNAQPGKIHRYDGAVAMTATLPTNPPIDTLVGFLEQSGSSAENLLIDALGAAIRLPGGAFASNQTKRGAYLLTVLRYDPSISTWWHMAASVDDYALTGSSVLPYKRQDIGPTGELVFSVDTPDGVIGTAGEELLQRPYGDTGLHRGVASVERVNSGGITFWNGTPLRVDPVNFNGVLRAEATSLSLADVMGFLVGNTDAADPALVQLEGQFTVDTSNVNVVEGAPWAVDDLIYLSPVPGRLRNFPPVAPGDVLLQVGIVRKIDGAEASVQIVHRDPTVIP